MQYIELIASYYEEVTALIKSAKPPKAWWEKMKKKIKKNNPSYSDEQVRKTIGNIWYNKLSKSKRSELRKKEGKTLK